MTEKPEASVLTARRAAQHFRLSSADDACEHLYILTVRSSLGPSPPNAGRYTVASRFRRRSCERGYIFPRAPEQFVTSPLCLVGYARWDARSDRVPPLQTIIFSSFPGRTKGCRPSVRNPVCGFAERRFGPAAANFNVARRRSIREAKDLPSIVRMFARRRGGGTGLIALMWPHGRDTYCGTASTTDTKDCVGTTTV